MTAPHDERDRTDLDARPDSPLEGALDEYVVYVEFERRREGMIHAMDGGLWLHRHVWKGRAMAHLVSTDRERLLAYGRAVGLTEARLQFKPLKDPRTTERREAWHWDLLGRFLPPRTPSSTPDPAATDASPHGDA